LRDKNQAAVESALRHPASRLSIREELSMTLYVTERNRILQDPTMAPWLKSTVLKLHGLDEEIALRAASTLFALCQLRRNEIYSSGEHKSRDSSGETVIEA
jgi:hypothetical protein